MYRLLLIALVIPVLRCSTSTPANSSKNSKDNVAENNPLQGTYWYQGKAEVNSYSLTQARYGQLHQGEAVCIFVSEDFNARKQVKTDDPMAAGADRQPVLKLNMLKRFNTGIYTYSLMMSAFSAIGDKVPLFPLKVSCCVQDWCGQVFSQLNNRNDQFEINSFSYFESEGDQRKVLKAGWSEDGLWNQIRINPQKLPIGSLQLLPGFFYLRLRHRPMEFLQAEASQRALNDSIMDYTVRYPSENRELVIRYKKAYPFQIIGWTETYNDGENLLTTHAELRKSLMTDYWTKHNVADSIWRRALDLE
ncbi:MAG: hypothetical protein K1X68_06550 [Saprospiraceae bacterium]|nr:hypothetical protein [Saprospiraceae bacterium]HNA58044.1 hypothetical protein [Chitinophagales bacterium]HMX89661.1 hypothetical protein [Saprospiraceae bacterium]HMZ41071.1 hypothetical protein [Saprospiraceae bacterium]HNB32045.1 hypothetical protein [Saprospiraceae bacterium]